MRDYRKFVQTDERKSGARDYRTSLSVLNSAAKAKQEQRTQQTFHSPEPIDIVKPGQPINPLQGTMDRVADIADKGRAAETANKAASKKKTDDYLAKQKAIRDAQDPKSPFWKAIKDNTVDQFAEMQDRMEVGKSRNPLGHFGENIAKDVSNLGKLMNRFSQSSGNSTGVDTQAAGGAPILSTGNKILDKTADIAGSLGGMAVNPAALEQGLISGGYRAAGALAGSKVGRAITRGNSIADRALQGATAGAIQNTALSGVRGDTNANQLGRAAAEGAAFGAAGDVLGSVLAKGVKRGVQAVRERPLNKEIDSFVGRTAAPEVQDTGTILPRDYSSFDLTSNPTKGTLKPPVVRPISPIGDNTAQGAELAGNFRRGEKLLQQYDDAVNKQYEYLKQSMKDRGGVQQGNLIRDPTTGEVIDRYGRTSSNPRWYRDFFAENGRKPTNKDLRLLAKEHINKGYLDDNAGTIPPWKPADIQDIDGELASIRSAMDTAAPEERAALQEVASSLESSRSQVKQQLPEGSQAFSRKSARDQVLERTGQQMKADPIPFRPADPAAKVKPISQREIRKMTEKLFNIPIRTGRLGSTDKDVLGVYKIHSEVVRTRNQGGLQELSHELGHHFDKKYKLQDPAYHREMMDMLTAAGAVDVKAYTSQELESEGPAEFIRLFLTDPESAKKLAPRFFDHFVSSLPASEMKKLDKVQEAVSRWIDQGEVMQFRGKIVEAHHDSKGTIGERAEKAYGDLVDKLTHLATVEKEINKLAGGDKKLGDASVSAYKRARLVAGTPKKAQMIVDEMVSIFKPLEEAKIPLRDFRDFATALHADEMEMQGIESGWTLSQIQKAIREYDSPIMRKVQKDIVSFQNRLIDMAVDGQLLMPEGAAAMKKKYPNYVPMYREMDEDIQSGLISGKGFADLNNPIKKLKGSLKDVKDPIGNIVHNVFSIIDHIEKNKVGLELSRMAKVEGSGKWIERLNGAESVRTENIVTVWENGQKVQYQLEPELYRTIKQMDEDVSNTVVKMLSVPTQLLRGGATLAPEFILRNPIRDQFTAYVTSEFGYNPVIDLPKGMFRVLKGKLWKNGDQIYEQWLKEGGGYGNTHSLDRNYLREQVKKLKDERNPWARRTVAIVNPKDWLRLLQSMSELTEEATKVGEFARGIRKGATPEEAAYQSRDLMDFARVGNSIKQLNRVDAFLNANIQGKDKLARAFIKNPVRTTIRALNVVTVPTIAFYLYNERFSNEKQRETLRESPQWLRDTFYLVSVPGTDVVARIPKPFDLAPVFSNLFENIMRWTKGNDPQAWGDFTKSQVLQLINIPYMLTALAPAIENMTNYDFFTKGPVVPRRDQDAEPKNQYGNNTSSVAKEIGAITNYSPYKIDNFISGYTASLGKHVTSGIDAILDNTGISTRPPAAAKKFSELPVVNSFTVNNNSGGKSLDDFYKMLDEIGGKYNSFTKHGEGDRSIVPEYKAFNKIQGKISDLNAKRREAQANYNMTPREKRDYLDDLDEHIKNLARQGIKISKKR